MAGHSKWSKVKHIKGVLDVRRGKIFSKCSREITVAARLGGGDPAMNARLRSAILSARAQNMPNENIERAIKKGTGELEGQQLEELIYEGYAPGGVAVIVEAMTDNKNRTSSDLRHIFSKNNGHLATSGSVSYMFHRKGQITVPRRAIDEDRLLGLVLDAGAEEMTRDDEHFTITTSPERLYAVGDALKNAGVAVDSQKLTFISDTTVPITDEKIAAQLIALCQALDDCDDVQQVHANFDIADEAMAKVPA